jgi:hypothetical protein
MRAILKSVCLIVAVGFMTVAPASAAIINFENLTTDGGTLSYAGGAAPLVGTNILFDTVIVTGGTMNDGSYACVGCVLNFTTGGHVGSVLSTEFWAAGGTFTVTGAVTGVVGNTTLLSGSFGAGGMVGTFGTGGFTVGGSGLDSKNPDFLAFFGLTNPFIYTNTDFTAASCTGGGGAAFSCEVSESDLTNTDVGVPGAVPEPASLLLLGTGLVGIGQRVRRRMKKASAK